MKITCPHCQHIFFAATRHVACQKCKANFDVWGTIETPGRIKKEIPRRTVQLPTITPERDPYSTSIGAVTPISDEVLELPAPGPIGERASETSPVLEPSFSVLPLELLNRKAAATELALAVVDQAGESGAVKRRNWLWIVAFAAIAVIAVGGFYLSRAISSVGQGEALTTVAAATAESAQPLSKASVAAGSSAQAVTDHRSENGAKLKVSPLVKAVETAQQPEKTEPSEQIPTRPRIVAPIGNFSLQIAARPDEAEAKKIAAQMQDAGTSARVVRVELSNRGIWYRVYVGAFETRAEAESYGAQLKRAGTIEEFLIADLRHR
jgi:hypothetical protein